MEPRPPTKFSSLPALTQFILVVLGVTLVIALWALSEALRANENLTVLLKIAGIPQ